MVEGIRQIMFEHRCPECNKYFAALSEQELDHKIEVHSH